jgi:hypothetical protein
VAEVSRGARRKGPLWVCGAIMVATTASLAACGGSGLEGGPISLEFSSDRTMAEVGEQIRFLSDARGSNIQATLIEYGDGDADTIFAFNSLTHRVSRPHAYEQPGSYVAQATVQDFFQGAVSQTIAIEITDPAQASGDR